MIESLLFSSVASLVVGVFVDALSGLLMNAVAVAIAVLLGQPVVHDCLWVLHIVAGNDLLIEFEVLDAFEFLDGDSL